MATIITDEQDPSIGQPPLGTSSTGTTARATTEPCSVDGIIACINALPLHLKRELTIKVRTTDIGIKAYVAFLYGAQ